MQHGVHPGTRAAARGLAAWTVTLTAGVGFALLLLLVRTRWEPLRRADQALADALNSALGQDERLVKALRLLTDLGGTPMLLWLLSVGVLWLLIRGQWRTAGYVAVTALGALALTGVVKELVGRLRPVVAEPLSDPAGLSFPSGHALGSVVAYGVLLLVFAPVTGRRARPWFAAAVAAVVLLVGFTRLALGVHYVSDVLAGWLLGLVWLALTAVVFRRWPPQVPPAGADAPSPGRPEAPRNGLPGAPRSGASGSGTPGSVSAPAPHTAAPLPGAGTPGAHAPEADLRPVPPRHPPALPHPVHALAELLVAWGLLAGLLYALGTWLTGGGPEPAPPAWDRTAAHWAAGLRTPWLNTALAPLEFVGSTPGAVGGALLVGPLAVAVTRNWRPLVLLAVGLTGEVTLFLVLTETVARSRPDVPHLGPGLPPTSSFPSGHAAAVLTLCLCTLVIVRRATRSRAARAVALAVAVVVPAAVAFQRLYAGAHYPGDLAGSLLLALPWTAVACWVTRPPRHPVPPPGAAAQEQDRPPAGPPRTPSPGRAPGAS
ncbi:phosphatase PAP2 family protein [Streptomyces sp. JJ36]|uniref:phosphatase PAP2 family protein n=1 Tax=Streptomyces sp. JJ36 TaxID=2736645 RepID=UPI001F2A3795|nr:phosphatase PAP2 family protein [Streptomyces sp. JJ36]MCF6521736.1 phosphatase PAP2 family protein [Streptomyces sp. JJ36]